MGHLSKCAPRVAKKIVRDSVMTTGAAWKSKTLGQTEFAAGRCSFRISN